MTKDKYLGVRIEHEIIEKCQKYAEKMRREFGVNITISDVIRWSLLNVERMGSKDFIKNLRRDQK